MVSAEWKKFGIPLRLKDYRNNGAWLSNYKYHWSNGRFRRWDIWGNQKQTGPNREKPASVWLTFLKLFSVPTTGPPPPIIGSWIFGVKIQDLTSETPAGRSFRERPQELLDFLSGELSKIFLKAEHLACFIWSYDLSLSLQDWYKKSSNFVVLIKSLYYRQLYWFVLGGKF